jgi:hypothetical protein
VPALVNDLDLEVIAPDGHVYRGNQFLEGYSIPDSPTVDNLNNVECVFIAEPIPGQYIVRVRARNVPQGPQDFALVTFANLPAPDTGFVFFDRRAYTAPGRINVKVVDSDLNGQPSVNVTVRSTTQPAGVALSLKPNGIPNTFTGSVATVSTTVAGSLRISHNDTIDTSYFDASAGATRTATARGDLNPPVISGVGTSNAFGQTVVFWQTDENANSLVRYNTNSTLTRAASNQLFSTEHAVSLSSAGTHLFLFCHFRGRSGQSRHECLRVELYGGHRPDGAVGGELSERWVRLWSRGSAERLHEYPS